MLTSTSSSILAEKLGYREMFRQFKAAGLDAVDFDIDLRVKTIDDIKATNVYGKTEAQLMEQYGEIKKIADREGIIVGQTHSLFGGFPTDVQRTPEFFEATCNSIIATHALGCPITVVHPVRLVEALHGQARELSLDVNEAFYRQFIPVLRKYNVKIAIEDIGCSMPDGTVGATCCSHPEDMVELVNRLGDDCFCTCADLGHFALLEPDLGVTPANALRILGKTVGALHIHEVNLIKDSHTVPFTFPNVMDWNDIIAALREIGYNGILNFEVLGHVKQYPDSLLDESIRHIAAIARWFAKQLEYCEEKTIWE